MARAKKEPGVRMICVSVNTECHRTRLADVFTVLAPGALPEQYIANIRASLVKHVDCFVVGNLSILLLWKYNLQWESEFQLSVLGIGVGSAAISQV